MKTKSESRARVKKIHEKKIWAYSKPSRKHSWQKLECTLENNHEKKSEHIRSQLKSVQMNVKQHVLGTSKNGKNQKNVKERTENKRTNKFFPSFFFIKFIFLYFYIWIKIPISVTGSWRDLIILRFLVVHIINFFLFGLRFLFTRNRRYLIELGFLVI